MKLNCSVVSIYDGWIAPLCSRTCLIIDQCSPYPDSLLGRDARTLRKTDIFLHQGGISLEPQKVARRRIRRFLLIKLHGLVESHVITVMVVTFEKECLV